MQRASTVISARTFSKRNRDKTANKLVRKTACYIRTLEPFSPSAPCNEQDKRFWNQTHKTYQ